MPDPSPMSAHGSSTAAGSGDARRARRRARRHAPGGSSLLGAGIVTSILAFVVLLPLSAVVWKSASEGTSSFTSTLSNPQAQHALKFTLLSSLAVALVAAVMGTLIAWVLVRDRFPGAAVVDMVIDLPFALPTIVAGLTLMALYGSASPVGIDIAYTKAAVIAALLFVTLPFVVRSVQPVLKELDRAQEEAASSLGARPLTTFRLIILPHLMPAILTGTGLSFAKAIGEFGSVVLISGNRPGDTEVASVYVFGLIESGDIAAASAVSAVLLGISVVVLAGIDVIRRRYGR